MTAYIYIIENKETGACYIGKTVDIERRWLQHRQAALKGEKYKISRALAKYGFDAFEFRVLEEHHDEEYALKVLEPRWIEKFRLEGRKLYNMTDGGEGFIGLEFSDEHRRKLREAALARGLGRDGGPLSEETKRKISEKNKGKVPSEETKRKMSASATRRYTNRPPKPPKSPPKKPGMKPGTKLGPMSDEHRAKLREVNLGKSHSENVREKISESLRGKPKPPRSDEHCRKLSEAAQKRGPMSDEQREKISKGVKASANVGHPIDEATRARISEKLKGQVQSEETRAKRAESMRRAWERRKAAQEQALQNSCSGSLDAETGHLGEAGSLKVEPDLHTCPSKSVLPGR
jgi:group I intron endonuclease